MKNKPWIFCILILAAINIYWFWPGHLYFLNDDLLHIPLTDQGHFFQTNSVRPIHELLVRLDLFFWGKSSYGYHITALVLHFIVCFQLYDLCLVIQIKLMKIQRHQATQAALLAVVLFLAYPQSSESIAWILGRTPVLSAIFFMVTVRLFFGWELKWPTYFIGAFFFATALFTYEQILLLPVALAWIAFTEKEKVKRLKMFWYVFVLAVVDIAYIIVRKLITSEVVGGYEGGNWLGMQWLKLSANAMRFFSRLVLNPANKTGFVCSAIILVIVTGSIILAARKVQWKTRPVIFFAAITLLLIAPVLSLGVAINSFESGRYLYLPSVFFVGGISITGVAAFYHSVKFQKSLIVLFIVLTVYWLRGKYTASYQYTQASVYAEMMETRVQQHFKTASDTLYIDTLRVTVHNLPVFRLGFKTGANWFNNNMDTNKIKVKFYYDEDGQASLK